MPLEAQRHYDAAWAFAPSWKKQTNMATVLVDGDLTAAVPVFEVTFPEETRQYRSDLEAAYKGHEYATPLAHKTITKDVRLRRILDGSTLSLGWLMAGALGSVSSVQPNAGGNPTAWRHTFTPFSPNTAGSLAMPVTTIYDQPSNVTGWQSKLRACAVARWAIRARSGGVWQAEVEIATSGERVADPVTVPALSSEVKLDIQNTVFKLGALGAGVDISDRFIEFEVTGENNLKLELGYHPGSGQYRGRIWVGARRFAARALVILDRANSDIMDLVRNDTQREFSIKGSGAQIGGGPEVHDCELFFPSVRIGQAPVRLHDDILAHEFSVPSDVVYQDAAAGVVQPFRAVITNLQTVYLN